MAAGLKALVCDEAWEHCRRQHAAPYGRSGRSGVGSGGGSVQGMKTETGKGLGVLAPDCYRLRTVGGEGAEGTKQQALFSNHTSVVLKAFVIEAYFQMLQYLATFLKRLNDSNSVSKSAIMKHDRHQCLFGSKKYPVFKCICWLALST